MEGICLMPTLMVIVRNDFIDAIMQEKYFCQMNEIVFCILERWICHVAIYRRLGFFYEYARSQPLFDAL